MRRAEPASISAVALVTRGHHEHRDGRECHERSHELGVRLSSFARVACERLAEGGRVWLCDRLVRKHLVARRRSETSRREIEVRISDAGRELVDSVTRRRRGEIRRILDAVPDNQQAELVGALHAFASAAGEVPEQAWSLGWSS